MYDPKLTVRKFMFGWVFWIGTLAAVAIWMLEKRGWMGEFDLFSRHWSYIVIAHVLQVIGMFGYLITPDRISGRSITSNNVEKDLGDERDRTHMWNQE